MYPELLGRITLYAGGAIPEGWEVADDETD